MNTHAESAGIVAICCGLCLFLVTCAFGIHSLFAHGHTVRVWLLATLTPSFAYGTVFGAVCVACAVLIWRRV